MDGGPGAALASPSSSPFFEHQVAAATTDNDDFVPDPQAPWRNARGQRVPPPDRSRHWHVGPWERSEVGRHRQWTPTGVVDDWELLSVSPASAALLQDADAGSTAGGQGSGSWSSRLFARLTATVSSSSDAASSVPLARLRRFAALQEWIGVEAHIVFALPLQQRDYHVGLLRALEGVQSGDAGAASLAALLEQHRKHVVQHWLDGGDGEMAAVGARTRRALQRLSAALVGDEHVACVNAIQPLHVLAMHSAADAHAHDDDDDDVTDESLVAINTATAIYGGAIVVRTATHELYPLEWFWSGAHGELVALNNALVLREPTPYRVALPARRWLRFRCAQFVYSGDALDGLACGKGMLEEPQCTYVGAFAGGVRDGKGVQVSETAGTKWVGVWRGGVRAGPGLLHERDGSLVRCARWTPDGQPAATVVVTRPARDELYVGAPNVGFAVEVAPQRNGGETHFGNFAGRVRAGPGVTFCAGGLVRAGTWVGGAMQGRGTLEVAGALALSGVFAGDAALSGATVIWPAPPLAAAAATRWSCAAAPLSCDEFATIWAALLDVRPWDASDWHVYVASVRGGDYAAAERACFDAHPGLYRAVWQRLVARTGEREDVELGAAMAARAPAQWRHEPGPDPRGARTIAGLDALRSVATKLDCIADWVEQTTRGAADADADALLPLLIHSLCESALRCPRAHCLFIEQLRAPPAADSAADARAYCFVLFASCVEYISNIH